MKITKMRITIKRLTVSIVVCLSLLLGACGINNLDWPIGWTESELEALAVKPPRDYDPLVRTPEQQAIEEEIQPEIKALLDDQFAMEVYPETGEKYWHGRAYTGMGHILSYLLDGRAGSYIRFPGEDRFLTSLVFDDLEQLVDDAIILVEESFWHLPTVNHVDLITNRFDFDSGTITEQHETYTVSRGAFEAALQNESLTNQQKFEAAFVIDDFGER